MQRQRWLHTHPLHLYRIDSIITLCCPQIETLWNTFIINLSLHTCIFTPETPGVLAVLVSISRGGLGHIGQIVEGQKDGCSTQQSCSCIHQQGGVHHQQTGGEVSKQEPEHKRKLRYKSNLASALICIYIAFYIISTPYVGSQIRINKTFSLQELIALNVHFVLPLAIESAQCH